MTRIKNKSEIVYNDAARTDPIFTLNTLLDAGIYGVKNLYFHTPQALNRTVQRISPGIESPKYVALHQQLVTLAQEFAADPSIRGRLVAKNKPQAIEDARAMINAGHDITAVLKKTKIPESIYKKLVL